MLPIPHRKPVVGMITECRSSKFQSGILSKFLSKYYLCDNALEMPFKKKLTKQLAHVLLMRKTTDILRYLWTGFSSKCKPQRNKDVASDGMTIFSVKARGLILHCSIMSCCQTSKLRSIWADLLWCCVTRSPVDWLTLFLASSSARTKKGAQQSFSAVHRGSHSSPFLFRILFFVISLSILFLSVLENMGMRTQGDLRLKSLDRRQSLVHKPTARQCGQLALQCHSSVLSAAHSWPNPTLNQSNGNLSTDFNGLSIRAQARAWLD